jgi:hypothetical protein
VEPQAHPDLVVLQAPPRMALIKGLVEAVGLVGLFLLGWRRAERTRR